MTFLVLAPDYAQACMVAAFLNSYGIVIHMNETPDGVELYVPNEDYDDAFDLIGVSTDIDAGMEEIV